MLPVALRILIVLFPLSEIGLAFLTRSRLRGMRSEDHGSMRLLWIAIGVGLAAAIAAEWVRAARLPVPLPVLRAVALALLAGGLALRWAAIVHLGRFFTVDVAIAGAHRVVDTGPYRFVRHPSYTGLLLAFLGLGLSFANALSLVALMVPVALAVAHRVGHEEAALRAALGAEYEAYCARTRRFVPGLL